MPESSLPLTVGVRGSTTAPDANEGSGATSTANGVLRSAGVHLNGQQQSVAAISASRASGDSAGSTSLTPSNNNNSSGGSLLAIVQNNGHMLDVGRDVVRAGLLNGTSGEIVNLTTTAQPQPTSLEERKSPLVSTVTMQGSDAVRLSGISEAISQQIAKYDSSEFDDDKETVGTDAEGVWAPEIEQSFQEALAIYPPCGRRKIILSDEGKMYGRNELIARYIKLRTGKTRTRKQVSSHIQVLARRKLREIQAKLKVPSQNGSSFSDQAQKDKALQQMQQMSSAQIVTASAVHNKSLSLLSSSTANTTPPASNSSYPQPQQPQQQQQFWQPPALNLSGTVAAPNTEDLKPFAAGGGSTTGTPAATNGTATTDFNGLTGVVSKLVAAVGGGGAAGPAYLGRCIATTKLRLLEHSAFVEEQGEHDSQYHKHLFVHIGGPTQFTGPLLEPVDVRQIQDKFPEKSGGLKELYDKGPQDAFFLVKFWADLNTNIADESIAFYGVTTTYESTENMVIQCSTKVCSFGKQVVEKVETEYAKYEGGRYLYKIHRSPMCEYMINFILKLKHLPEKYMMNSVLENFTILQVITNRDTGETLLCIAYVFEVSTSEHGAQHHIYRLVKD